MNHLLTNVTLRANRLPTITLDQLALLGSDELLAREFTGALDGLERHRVEDATCDSYDLASGRTPFRTTLLAIIAELSLQRPAAHPELADEQARVRAIAGG